MSAVATETRTYMRAVITGPNTVVMENVPLPEIAPDQVLMLTRQVTAGPAPPNTWSYTFRRACAWLRRRVFGWRGWGEIICGSRGSGAIICFMRS